MLPDRLRNRCLSMGIEPEWFESIDPNRYYTVTEIAELLHYTRQYARRIVDGLPSIPWGRSNAVRGKNLRAFVLAAAQKKLNRICSASVD